MNTGQFYFSKKKLQELLQKFESDEFRKRVGDRDLKGFVFTPGRTAEGKPTAFAFPVFTMPGETMANDTIVYQNTDPAYGGCPYPPPCDDDGGSTGV